MSIPATVTVLGCGNSMGTPVIGCSCAVCTGGNPKNMRMRASILIESATTKVLIDCGPDVRYQALKFGFTTVDAVVLTHAHADHIGGADEIRNFNIANNDWMVVYGDIETLREFAHRCDYMFHNSRNVDGNWFKPCVIASRIEHNKALTIGDITLLPIHAKHGRMDVLGFRIGDFAYMTDCHLIPEASLALMQGLDTLIIDCVNWEITHPSPTHSDWVNTAKWIEQLAPKTAFLTHMSHHMDYADTEARTPAHVHPAHDGLRIDVLSRSF
ncbi:MAG: MBL fold metallo-hydrolase [Proteobacteria bacterium]|nr:MBL fold metallo-hydrolase [Pseudomonadota bacterium]